MHVLRAEDGSRFSHSLSYAPSQYALRVSAKAKLQKLGHSRNKAAGVASSGKAGASKELM